MKKILMTIAALWLVTAAYAGPQDAYDKTMDGKKIGWMQKGMEATKAKLKDPSSAKFRGVYFHQGADGIPMTCGEVNSKNSFGGYGGFHRFFSAGKSDLTFLEEQVADFSTVWNQFCQ
ncbi:MAG: hypothetical protein JZU65_17695 [Chlorobium sp.]|jgi:hypothetical protein|nr:hypothetical protein [Chlorobium sp.]